MGWFSSTTGLERQKEIFNEQMEVKQEELNKLDGVDTAESAVRREQLTKELADIEVSKEQVRSQMELQGMDQGMDFFND